MAESHRQVPRQPETRSEAPIIDPPKPPSSYLPDDASLPQPTQARADAIIVDVSGGEGVVMRGVMVEAAAHDPPVPTQEEADRIRGGSLADARALLELPQHPPLTPTQEEGNQYRTRVMGAGDAQQYQTR